MGAQKLEKIRLNEVFACGFEIRITNIHCLPAALLLLQQRDERVAILRLHFGKTIVHYNLGPWLLKVAYEIVNETILEARP